MRRRRAADRRRATAPRCAPGEAGELLTRGPYTLRGYYRAPEHNAAAFTPDGFYCSGDLVRALPSGHLVVEGRIKDTIDRGGETVSADEVEHHVVAHPAVRRAAVIGLPDGGDGERMCAVVVARAAEPPALRELRAFLIAARRSRRSSCPTGSCPSTSCR